MDNKKKHTVDCCHCLEDFEVDYIQSDGNEIECPHCKGNHNVDTDYDEDDNTFWYLQGIYSDKEER